MTTSCDLCGDENCVPIFNEIDFHGQKIPTATDSHVCEKDCKEATGMEYRDYVQKFRYYNSTINAEYSRLTAQ